MFVRGAEFADERGGEQHRSELLKSLAGRVIDVGAGHGRNFRHYPETVTEVVAVEPEVNLHALALKAADHARVPIRVVSGFAEELPAEDGSFDAGVVSLVLCSVEDQRRVLSELLRVIRPGGELRFYEHVRAPSSSLARFQRVADLLWPRLGAGCHVSRDTKAEIERAGFEIESCREFSFRPMPLLYPASPHILGVARRPGQEASGR
jgi:ubiquinone/menaquinone biosynthesis C-methylase UbiE